ncbi:hypothetical protein GWI33_020288 [Rhynchophorus ferrugineus]|uniref:Uncharacterized protein n=1 Tax=Rhynchophorus ferrugineus TaxID=354439 RepID=A0A834HSQ3_RHYFE|nr:hypothetical protein GWI33_020288 [Rhynchophorus ferrugineus]
MQFKVFTSNKSRECHAKADSLKEGPVKRTIKDDCENDGVDVDLTRRISRKRSLDCLSETKRAKVKSVFGGLILIRRNSSSGPVSDNSAGPRLCFHSDQTFVLYSATAPRVLRGLIRRFVWIKLVEVRRRSSPSRTD